ncbi:MAG: ATP-binding protein [Neomegalonema sp.]|nr:ATP-binding protein [Neomegalonema sp.]
MTPPKLARTLTGRIMLLAAGALLIAQIFNIALLVDQRRLAARAGFEERVVDRFAAAAERARMLVRDPSKIAKLPLALRPHPRAKGVYFLSKRSLAAARTDAAAAPRLTAALRERLAVVGFDPSLAVARRGRVGRPPLGDGEPHFVISRQGEIKAAPRLRPGPPPPPHVEEILLSYPITPRLWLNSASMRPPANWMPLRIGLATLAMLVLVIGAMAIFARRIAQPLRDLARAAAAFGQGDATAQPVRETGPIESRDAARAFNAMRRRITSLLETQSFMLRSVGHDLRTPLTALRLRIENVENPELREKMKLSLNEIQGLTEEILAWTKDTSATEPLAPVDLGALLESLIDDYVDQGAAARYIDGPRIVAPCRRAALRRAIRNLIDNALAYAGDVEARMTRTPDGFARIEILDRGPGLPEEALEKVLNPFVRLENSRNRGTGGTGLGLAIAHAIMEAHEGRLEVSNRPQGGLCAALMLPMQTDQTSEK